MGIIIVPINDLNPSDYNARKWSDKASYDLIESIKKFGLVNSVIANNAEGRWGSGSCGSRQDLGS